MNFREILRSPGHPVRMAVIMAGIASLAFLADFFLNHFAFGDGWTILWPLNGFTVAALLMLPRRRWLPVLAAVAFGTYFGEVQDGNGWIDELCIRAISFTEVLLAALLLPPFVTLEDWLFEPHIFRRLLCAFAVGPGVSGLMAAVYFHVIHGQSYFDAFCDWGPADMLGLATIMPLVFAIRSKEIPRLFRPDRVRRTALILGLAFSGSVWIFYETRYPVIFTLYPVLLLVDLMLGFAASTLAVAWVCLIAVWLTTHGEGPFANLDNAHLPINLSLQIYLGFHILILFPASILFLERRRVNRQLREAYSQMSQLAAIDQLTGIANRRTLDIAIVRTWEKSLRDHEHLAILMVDVDYFKEYNDSAGHQEGDRCLAAIATALATQATRPEDVVARYGGEEFSVLLPNTSPEGAHSVATKILETVRELKYRHPTRGSVSVSVGCAALVPSASNSSGSLLDLADKALYLAKKTGRNRVHSLSEQDADG